MPFVVVDLLDPTVVKRARKRTDLGEGFERNMRNNSV